MGHQGRHCRGLLCKFPGILSGANSAWPGGRAGLRWPLLVIYSSKVSAVFRAWKAQHLNCSESLDTECFSQNWQQEHPPSLFSHLKRRIKDKKKKNQRLATNRQNGACFVKQCLKLCPYSLWKRRIKPSLLCTNSAAPGPLGRKPYHPLLERCLCKILLGEALLSSE